LDVAKPTRIAPLDDLVAQLQRVYGAGLSAVVLFGSAAGGDHVAGRSDHNVLVLVDAVTVERLQATAAALIGWTKAGHPPPQLMTVAEWRSAADAFPMEYADILERHRVLYPPGGTAPFDGLRVGPADLRLQVEHEARGKVLRLRNRVMALGTSSGAEVIELLARASSTIMVVFRGVERLHGAVPSTDSEVLSRAVAARVGADAEPFVRVVKHARGTTRLLPADAFPVLTGYLAGLDRVVAHVDGLTV
jgi:hypothetical protein